ncbi:MAG: hypothetical protein DBX46_03850 [Clostridiales bacterium]|nr:MAG: hypothetical protein DBX46_03850 [Clostridiales bacterium]
MFQKFKARYITFFIVAGLIFVTLAIQLNVLITSVEEEQMETQVEKTNQKTVSFSGARGSIMDANGILLAYDVNSYNVTFYKDPSKSASSDRAHYTEIIKKTINLVESNGGNVIDTFLIRRDGDGSYYYDVTGLSETAQKKRIERFCNNMQVSDSTKSAEEVYYELRSKYRISEDVSYNTALKILSVWQEIQNSYSYVPVTIAYDVDFNTVSEITTKQNELTGMDVEESTVRVYPKQSTAAHTIGYLGSIVSDNEIEKYIDQEGYDAGDFIGKTGIEATMEEYLTASSKEKQGQKVLELDENGTVTGQVSYIAAKNGDNVQLNLDLKLQQVVEQALEENVKEARADQERQYEEGKESTPTKKGYDEKLAERTKKEIDFITSGAAIVMDVKTGAVKAISSYPSFDLNLFVGGISEEDYAALTDEDAGSPLFNNAVSSRSTPGSVFKMITAVAGLMEGEITTNTIINDEGPFTEGIEETGRAPTCWVKPYYNQHGPNQNVTVAIKNSCNYFFYTVASKLGITKLNEWADNFGVTSKTNIEVTGEATGFVGNQQNLYDNSKAIDNQTTYKPQIVFNALKSKLRSYGEERDVEYSEKQLDTACERIVELYGDGQLDHGREVRTVLSEELDIPVRVSLSTRGETGLTWYQEIGDIARELVWTDLETVTSGIGTSITQLTPIAVCRYICALVNGGKVLEPHLISKITDSEGNVVKEVGTTVIQDLELPEDVTTAIKKGMEQVVSGEDGGTAGKAFADFEYKDQIAGKTGTGPVSSIDLEDNVWLAMFAPREDPEIALVIFLPNGYSDNVKAFPTAKAILQYYFDTKKSDEEATESTNPTEGTMLTS